MRRSPTPPRRGKTQPRAARTKQAVLETALREFAEFGIEGARVDRIAARAKANKQALYYYFGSKDGLFRAALAAVYDRAPPMPAAAEPDDPAAALRALIAVLFDHFRTTERDSAIIAHENRYRGRHLTPPLRGHIRKAVLPVVAAIERALKRGQAAGIFTPDARADDVYLAIVALSHFYFMHAHTLSAILRRDLLAPAAAATWRKQVGDFVLASLRPPAGRKKSTR